MKEQDNTAKKKALELAISHIEKQFGTGAIMSLGDHSMTRGISTIKTGALSLDLALGIGGVLVAVLLKFMAQNHLENQL